MTLRSSDRFDVTVVLPFRDVEGTLREAMTSVLEERGVALELLAIDDGSRDGSGSIAAAMAARDARVRVIATGGVGIVGALNLGLSEARAPLVARMDGDDVCLPERLAAQHRAMTDDASLVALGTQVEAFPDALVEDGLRRYVAWQNALRTPADHAREVFIEAPLCHPSVMMRREALRAMGSYREGDFPEDYDLWLRLAARGHAMAKLDRLGLRWRHRTGRLTFSDPRYARERIRALKAEHLAAHLAREPRALALWGAGPFGRRLARDLATHGVRPSCFVDIDPRKIGRRAQGVPIVSHDGLRPETHFVVFVVGSSGARELVRTALRQARFVEGRDFLCAA